MQIPCDFTDTRSTIIINHIVSRCVSEVCGSVHRGSRSKFSEPGSCDGIWAHIFLPRAGTAGTKVWWPGARLAPLYCLGYPGLSANFNYTPISRNMQYLPVILIQAKYFFKRYLRQAVVLRNLICSIFKRFWFL